MELSEKRKQEIEAEENYRNSLQKPAAVNSQQNLNQKYGVPAVLSFFIPGLGQAIKGQVGRGILIFFGTIIGYFFLIIPGFIMWLWQISDAYNKPAK